MSLIGIRGHRGSGKKTVAYLLGRTIDYIVGWNGEFDMKDYIEHFERWCEDIRQNEDIIYNIDLKRVYFDSFGDAPRIHVKMLLGCNTDWLYSDYMKDHVVVCLNDFTCKEYDDVPSSVKTATEVNKLMIEKSKNGPADLSKEEPIFMTLREFILYFGIFVMQMGFGKNVWVKSYKANSNMFINIFNEEYKYRIYMDIKSISELMFVKDSGGVIINVERPGHKKKDTELSFNNFQDDDYKIKIGSKLEELADPVLKIARDIIGII